MAETKRELRKRIIAQRDLLSDAERKNSQTLLKERILSHQWFYEAKELLAFVSYGKESVCAQNRRRYDDILPDYAGRRTYRRL